MLRERIEPEGGFSLIEVLVVMLIIGILAAIAIPTLVGQQGKGEDASAKSMSRNAAAAAVAFANGGSFTGMTIGDMRGIEPSLNDDGSVGAIAELVGTPGSESFTVTTRSKSGKYYTVTRSGGSTFRCSSDAAPSGACGANDW